MPWRISFRSESEDERLAVPHLSDDQVEPAVVAEVARDTDRPSHVAVRARSWGANPLQQHIGLAKADRVAMLEIHWPTSGTTQVFRDIAADQAIEVTELAKDYKKLDRKPIPEPK